MFLLSLPKTSAGPGLAAATRSEKGDALMLCYQRLHSQPAPSHCMKDSASGACGGWWHTLLTLGKNIFFWLEGLPFWINIGFGTHFRTGWATPRRRHLLASTGWWRSCKGTMLLYR